MTKRILFIASLLLIYSCSKREDICVQNTSNPLVMQFYIYQYDSAGVGTKVQAQTTGSTILIENNGKKDTILSYAQALSSASIPLNPFSDSIRILFYLDSFQANPDYINVYYSSLESFIDLSCGIAHEYKLDSFNFSRFKIDSIKFKNKDLKLNNSDENLEILFF